jgi:outer membrane protein
MKKSLFITILFLFAGSFTFAQGLKIGYASFDTILMSLPEYEVKRKEIETYGKKLQDQVQALQQDYQTKVERYQKDGPNMVPAELEKLVAELQQLEQNLQERYQGLQTDLGRKESELMAPLVKKVQAATNQIAKEMGFDFVAQRQLFLYAKPDFDLTPAIIKKVGGKMPVPKQ